MDLRNKCLCLCLCDLFIIDVIGASILLMDCLIIFVEISSCPVLVFGFNLFTIFVISISFTGSKYMLCLFESSK